MSYRIPQPHKCEECGYEVMYSPHDGWRLPMFGEEMVCPKCWEKFIKERVPMLKTKSQV